MAWSQLGYNLYCFKQWYSPLTEACITQFQWLWVKYILIKMCKKWYPTKGLADFQNFPKSITSTAKTSKSKSPHLKISKSESRHFFKVPFLRIINLMKMTKSKFSAFSPYYFHVFSTFSPYFFNSALVMRRSAKNCGENAELRKGCGDLRYGWDLHSGVPTRGGILLSDLNDQTCNIIPNVYHPWIDAVYFNFYYPRPEQAWLICIENESSFERLVPV